MPSRVARGAILCVVGARPNFMKIAPIIDAIKMAQERGKNISYTLVHTGQHYDAAMSDEFFVQLGIPEPDINLGAGSGTQAEQTAAIMTGFERYLAGKKTDLVLVVGDATSTLACSIVAKKLHIRVAHVEGGIRSRDMTMPEASPGAAVTAPSRTAAATGCDTSRMLPTVCQATGSS